MENNCINCEYLIYNKKIDFYSCEVIDYHIGTICCPRSIEKPTMFGCIYFKKSLGDEKQ